jgi:hypothetical protein
MRNKETKSMGSFDSLKDKEYDTLQFRMEFIKELIGNTKLEPMVKIEDPVTENFMNPYQKNSKFANNARHVLNKKLINFNTIISSIGGKLQYIKSGSTGHAFKGYIKTEDGESANFAVKVVAYNRKYGDIYDINRPENAELMMIKLLSYFVIKKQTPYIILPIATFNTTIETFVKLSYNNIIAEKDEHGNTDVENKNFIKFVRAYENGDYHDNVSILISEWANRGDLLSFIRKNYKEFTLKYWKAIFFQIISVLAIIQYKYPSFRHNDFKANNVLIHNVLNKNESIEHTINYHKYVVPTIGYQIKIWDFDFACIPGIVNNRKVSDSWTTELNINPIQNRYYDMHYFFNSFIKKNFFGKFMTDPCIPKEAQDFVNRIVPPMYQDGVNLTGSRKDRIAVSVEYKIPEEVLRTDPFFEEYRRGPVSRVKKNPLSVDSIFEEHNNKPKDINVSKPINRQPITKREVRSRSKNPSVHNNRRYVDMKKDNAIRRIDENRKNRDGVLYVNLDH